MAELDIDPSLWFFECHFPGDPVMPGCLGLDAMWQLVGFFSWVEWTPWKRARTWSRRSKIYRSNPPNRDKGDLRNRYETCYRSILSYGARGRRGSRGWPRYLSRD